MTPRPARPSQLDQLAAQIREEHSYAIQALRAGVLHAIHAGELLMRAKSELPHGEWQTWIERKCKLSSRTARVYMRLAKCYGGKNGSALPFSSLREALKLMATALPDDEADLVEELPAPPLPGAAVSRWGDLWSLGLHRLLCGDATSVEAVARLLGGRKPRLMVTDPPYGGNNDGWWRNRAGINKERKRGKDHANTAIIGDDRGEWGEAFKLVPSLWTAYVWHQSGNTVPVLDGLLKLGFGHPTQLIWDKGRKVIARGHYSYEHEPCWYVRKNLSVWRGGRGENSTIWRSASPKVPGGPDHKVDHPNQKPLEFMRRPIKLHTLTGDLVYDPFIGSGTTMVASEELGRVCVGIDIDPKYVDVAIQRWQSLTGKQAMLEVRAFDEVAQERLGKQAQRLAAAG